MGPTRARREEARHSRDARGLPRASPEADGPARAAHVIEQCPATPPCQIGAGARHCCRWTRPDRLRVCRTDLRPSLKAVPATVCAPNGRQRRRQARWPSTAATRMLSRRPFRLRPRAGASFLSAFLSAARRTERASSRRLPPTGTTFSTVKSWCLLGCARARSGSQPFHTEPPVRCPRCRDENFAREIEIFVDSKGVKYPMALICSIAIRRLATSLVAKRGATTGQLVLFGKRLE